MLCAEAGIVAWNAVSKTATCGAAEKTSRATRIPCRWAGLWSGAIGITFSITASTVALVRASAAAPRGGLPRFARVWCCQPRVVSLRLRPQLRHFTYFFVP